MIGLFRRVGVVLSGSLSQRRFGFEVRCLGRDQALFLFPTAQRRLAFGSDGSPPEQGTPERDRLFGRP